MTVVTHIYNAYLSDMLSSGGAWTSATVKCALFSASTFTAADTAYTTSGTEVANANGYTTGGGAVGTRTITGTTTQACKITGNFGGGAAGTTTWTATGAGFSAVAAKLYVASGHPICHIDFGATQTASGGGTLAIAWDTAGVFSLAPSSTLFNIIDYGAAVGSSDNRAAIQAAIDAAAGQPVYVPAGVYRVIPSGGVGLDVSANLVMQGDGNTSVIEFYDDGLDHQAAGLSVHGMPTVSLTSLLLRGTVTAGSSYPSQYPSVQIISAEGVASLTGTNVTFDKGEYALKMQASGTRSGTVLFDGCTTLGNVMNPFFVSYVDSFTVQNSTLAAATVGMQAERYPHHFYLSTGITSALIDTVTCTGGQHVWETTGPLAVGGSITYHNIILNNVYQGGWDTETDGTLLYDGLTITNIGASSSANPWFVFGGTGTMTVKNFTIACYPNGQYLVADYGAAVLFQTGSVTNCGELSATPPGSYISSGTVTYSGVTVS